MNSEVKGRSVQGHLRSFFRWFLGFVLALMIALVSYLKASLVSLVSGSLE